nr:immunoglobulin heavy chain junction region [Macaca mulatta]MOW98853.1 immunoglobulin heavy chain junction region [Macaca mulatta]MOW99098.1 immunoglobulin heavy chain junction region [Macaca mulatta]MOW99288.1 immunoglobulin heavy chain junction region [Macaca mulatta]MOW99543.1 immunoglobulin heavy chain junction region [Macaca mulatta]
CARKWSGYGLDSW